MSELGLQLLVLGEEVKTWGAGGVVTDGPDFEDYYDPGIPLPLLPRSGEVNYSGEHVASHKALPQAGTERKPSPGDPG